MSSLATIELSNLTCIYARNPLPSLMTECSICLMSVSPECGILDCEHVFCWKCISDWIRSDHHSCPTCRKECTKVRKFYRSFPTGEVLTVAVPPPSVPLDSPVPEEEDDAEVVASVQELVFECLLECPSSSEISEVQQSVIVDIVTNWVLSSEIQDLRRLRELIIRQIEKRVRLAVTRNRRLGC